MRYLIAVIISIVLGWAPQLVLAQSPQELERFEAKVSQGQAHFENEEFEEAIDVLTEAEEIFEHPTLSVRIAHASVESGRCEAAKQRLQGLRQSSLPDDVEARLAGLERDVDQCVSQGTVIVDCSPSQARLRLNDGDHRCGDEIELETGSYDAEVSHDGYMAETIELTVSEREETYRSVTLRALEDESGADFPYEEVGLGGMATGVALMGLGLWVDSSASGRKDRIEAAARAGDFQTVDELESDAQTRRRQTIGLFGMGAVAASAGVAIYVLGTRADEPDTPGSFALFAGARSVSLQLLW